MLLLVYFLFTSVSSEHRLRNYKPLTKRPQKSETTLTSEGVLASGIEKTSNSISQLASRLDSNFDSINDKIDFSLVSNTKALEALLDDAISQKSMQISNLNSQIHSLMRSIKGMPTSCSGFRSCLACSYNPLCVWCEVEQLCVGGDSDGPFEGECKHFTYKGCSEGCGRFEDCESCQGDYSCGWCMNGGVCVEGTSSGSEECEVDFYYHSGSQCPLYEHKKSHYKNYDVYISPNPSSSNDSEKTNTENQIKQLRSEVAELEQEIEELQNAKSAMVKYSEKAKGIQSEEVNFKNPNLGLRNKANDLSRQEKDLNNYYLTTISKKLDFKNTAPKKTSQVTHK